MIARPPSVIQLCVVVLSTLLASAFLHRNDRLTLQTNRFFALIPDGFIVYGITQDCRVLFVDRSNLDLIRALRVDARSTYCYPNLVKLHLLQGTHRLSLLLVLKQADNRICTLPIEMPHLHTIASGRIFSYSILSSIPYMSCSHLPDSSFSLEPDLSFMDTSFSDVIYFINAKSTGSAWRVRRFQITERGHLQAMDVLTINYPRRDSRIGYDMANQFIVELDLKRSLLYTMNRFLKNLLSECSFDLLFRPEHVVPKWIEFDRDERRQTWLDSFSVDGDLLLFTESIREENGITSNVYATNLKQPNSTVHILIANFAADLVILKKPTILDLTSRNISKFDKASPLKPQRTMSSTAQKWPTRTELATSRPQQSTDRTRAYRPSNERTWSSSRERTNAFSNRTSSTRWSSRVTSTTASTTLTDPTTPTATEEGHSRPRSTELTTTEEVYYRRRPTEPTTTDAFVVIIAHPTMHSMLTSPTAVDRFAGLDKQKEQPSELKGANVGKSATREKESASAEEQSRRNAIGVRLANDGDAEISKERWNDEDDTREGLEGEDDGDADNAFKLPQNLEQDHGESLRPTARPTKHPRQHTGEPRSFSANGTVNAATPKTSSDTYTLILVIACSLVVFLRQQY